MRMAKQIKKDWRAQSWIQPNHGKLVSGRERFVDDEGSKEITIIGGYLHSCDKKKDTNFTMDKFVDDEVTERLEKIHSSRKQELQEESISDLSKDRSGRANTKAKWNLNDMAEEILQKVTLIRHDGNLYQYTGRSYKIIKNSEELLGLVRSRVSHDAFGSICISRFTDLLVFLKTDSRLIPKEYEKRLRDSQYYIAFVNGVLDVRTLELHSHSKKYLVFYELDVEWKKDGKPKRFLQFIEQASGKDKAVARRMVESLGYLLSVINEGKYFFVMGVAPDSGKSTLAQMLQDIIGTGYIAHISTYQMGNRFALGDIHGKTLNASMDLPKGKLNPVVVSIIKQITGGDVITTDQKYERMREIHSNMRFLFASNYPITVAKEDDDDSFWNRMIIVPFQYSVESEMRNYNLKNELLQEREAIISVCITALHEVMVRGCIFSKCEVAEKMKLQWREGEDDLIYTLQEFLAECISITGNKQDRMYARQLYDKYENYCKQREWGCMKYNKVMEWCEKNIPECERKRIHRTGTNPQAGFTGMCFRNSMNL